MLNERPYQVCLYVGPSAPTLEQVRVVDLTPVDADTQTVCATIRGASLTPEDLRSRVLFVADPDPAYRDRALVTYAALIGFANRRLDVAFAVDGQAMAMDELDRSVRTLPAPDRPAEHIDLAQAGGAERTDLPWVALGTTGISPDAVAVIKYARRLRLVPADHVQIALPQLVVVAALRARGATERLPLLCTGDEPADPDAGICLETARRGGEAARRDLRSGTRDALAPAEPTRFDRLEEADAVPVEKTLLRLGAKSKVVDLPARPGTPEHAAGVTVPTEVWHCPRPDRHTNGDATPSARIVIKDERAEFQCFRCDPERVGSLRLVMDTLGLTGDEAADWILQGR